jgi:tRNA/rRNA methyltransferase
MRPFLINVVLVRTLYDSNIGAASRAMANMGAGNLILIDHRCTITFKAQQAAATGQEAFQNRREYESWTEFFANEPEGIRLAFSARDGRGRPLWDLNNVLDWLKKEDPRLTKESETPLPIYLIFGPEDWGLSNEDLNLVHFNCNIPTFGDNSSLNLAQAVLLALFILRSNWGGERTKLDGQQPSRAIAARETSFPEQALFTWLSEMGFDLSKRRINAYTVMKRMLLHNVPTRKELRILDAVLQQSIRKLRQYNDLRKKDQESLFL